MIQLKFLGSAWAKKNTQIISEGYSEEAPQLLSYISIGSADREQH